MKKWLTIGGIVGVVALVGVTLLAATAFAQQANDRFGDFDGRPFGRGRFGAEGPAGFQGFRGEAGGFAFEGRGFERGRFGLNGEEGPGPRGGRRGVGGEVTAKGDNSLTVQPLEGDPVTVNVSDDTHVMVVETQSEGTLADVTVGSTVRVMGPRNDDDSVDARGIAVLPAGDHAGGRVTGVDGQTISVEGRDGPATLVTNADTLFRRGPEEAGLADVTEESFVIAFGQTQGDGSLAARLVLIHEGRGGPHGGPHGGPREGHLAGEVTAIDGTTLKLEDMRDNQEMTVLTDENTEYRTRGGEAASFSDISEGSMIMVHGQPVEGQENTVQAEVIGIKP